MSSNHIAQLRTCIDQQQFDAAEALAGAIVRQHPDHGEARHILGALLLRRGAIDDALRHLQVAATLLPDDAQVHNNLGCAFERSDQSQQAEHSYRRALQSKPDFVQAHHNLGVVLRVLGRYAESESSLRTALALHADYTDAHFNLGVTLSKLHHSEAAQHCFEKALRLNPRHTHALVALGNASASLGAFKKAEKYYLQALAIQPDNLAAWSAIPEIRKMTSDDLHWLHASHKVLPRCRHPREIGRYYFSMAKFYDDIGDPDQAFAHFRRANDISKQFDPPYQPQLQSAFTDTICAVFSKQVLQQRHAQASHSERPVFIIGMPRSGTSLVEQILASHPAICGAGELNFWTNAQHAALPELATLNPATIRDLADSYLQQLNQHSGSALRVTDKAPQNFANLGLILSVFPEARVLHLQRNSIDTCLSIYCQDFSSTFTYANDLHSLAHYYREYRRMMAHWRSVLPATQLLDVPYDGLVADQEGWSRKMIAFLGLEWHPHCLQFQRTQRKVETASQWQVRQGVYTSSVERWRKYEKHLGPLLSLADDSLLANNRKVANF